MADAGDVTQLLLDWRQGNEEALEKLLPVVYDELRRIAAAQMRSERSNHTLQPTAVVNEAYLKLVKMEVDWSDRTHFMAVAARLMRRLLVDHAKGKRRQKRHGGLQVTLEEGLLAESPASPDMLDLDEALTRLAELDERKARIVELHFFGGLTYEEVAVAVEVSPVTVHRDLRMAKAWLRKELRDPRESGER